MNNFFAMFIFILFNEFSAGLASPLENEGRTFQMPIVPQRLAKPNEYPFIVSIELMDVIRLPLCVGSIIGTHAVLTAGYCLGTFPTAKMIKSLVIVAGTNFLQPNNTASLVYRYVTRYSAHPRYRTRASTYDIAVLTVNKGFIFESVLHIQRISLAQEPIKDGTICYVVGWGSEINFSTDLENIPLKTTATRIYKREMCTFIYHISISDHQLCTERPQSYVKPCFLDIGSPLVCDNKLFGVGSRHPDCENLLNPDLFALVSGHNKFITYAVDTAEFSSAAKGFENVWYLKFYCQLASGYLLF